MKAPSPFLVLICFVLALSLRASGQIVLQNNSSVSSIQAQTDEQRVYRIDVPVGVGYLVVQTFGGQGNVNVYLRKGAVPTGATHDYASAGPANNELIEASRPGGASWYITLYAGSTFSAVTMQVFYGGKDELLLQPGEKIFDFQVDGWADSGAAIGRDGTIYIGANNDNRTGYLYAISDKGFQKWRQPLNGWVMTSAPVLGSDERLYVNMTDGINGSFGNLMTFLPNGTYQWTFERTSPMHPPTIGLGDIIYIPSDRNTLVALHPNKSIKWQFNAASGLIASTPAILGKDGVVYIGFHNPANNAGILYAIHPNGTKKWELPLPGKMSPPSIDAQGRILFGIVHPVNKLFAVHSTGQKAWEFAAPGGNIFAEVYNYSPPVVALDGSIYISCNRRLYAVDAAGKKIWHHDTSDSLASFPFFNAPVLDSAGNIHYGSFGNINAGRFFSLAPSGSLNWELSMAGQVVGYPVLNNNGRLVVASREGKKVYAIKAAGGAMSSQWPMARVTPQNTGSIELEAGPSVTINQAATQVDPTSGSTIQFTAIFSKPVTGFGNSDLLFGGTASPAAATVTGSGVLYTVSVTGMSKSGTVTVSIPAGVAMDAFGNPNFASTSTDNLVNYQLPDLVRPNVIINQAINQADPALAEPILFTVTFSEPVTGFTPDDLFISGTAGATTASVSGGGNVYTVAITGMVQAGSVTAIIPQGVVQDLSGNLNFASTSADNQVSFQPPVRFNITAKAFPEIGGVVTGSGQVLAQSTHRVTASPSPGYSFESWQENGNVVSGSPDYSFTVTGNRTLNAIFVKCNALLTQPAANANVSLPLALRWTMLGGCESKIYFATNATPQLVAAVTNRFGPGSHNFTLPMDQWKKVIQTLGTNQTYYWTIGSSDTAMGLTFAPWQKFQVPQPDSIAPVLSILMPLPQQVFHTNQIVVIGSATDGGRGNSGIKFVNVNGVDAVGGSVSAGNTAQWNAPLALQPGPNIITVVAADGQ
ncbi:MAG: PQQ-binding-like beta-propeller repeat protein, partial [Verrucomicrobiales bacterium]